MNEITNIIVSSALSVLAIAFGLGVRAIKQYLLKEGGQKALDIAEILARNAVQATEQVADKLDVHGEQKLEKARHVVISGLEQQGIHLTNSQIDNFIEAAVKQMNDNWKGSYEEK